MYKTGDGNLAHVDAGKTTLAEGILYLTGEIRKLGRVDHGDAFLDTHALEKARGITIFSKQAQISVDCDGQTRESPCWTRRGMWISPLRQSAHCRYWMRLFW